MTHIFQPNVVEVFVENARHSVTMSALFAYTTTNYFQNIYTPPYSIIDMKGQRNNNKCSIVILTRNRGHHHGAYQNSQMCLILKRFGLVTDHPVHNPGLRARRKPKA